MKHRREGKREKKLQVRLLQSFFALHANAINNVHVLNCPRHLTESFSRQTLAMKLTQPISNQCYLLVSHLPTTIVTTYCKTLWNNGLR